ncbi:hypothetical protein EMIT036CA2_10487 [Chryseobacterium sp. IT-36CA2]
MSSNGLSENSGSGFNKKIIAYRSINKIMVINNLYEKNSLNNGTFDICYLL